MKTTFAYRVLTLLLLATLLSGCDQVKLPGSSASKGPLDAGMHSAGSYTSTYFDFSLNFPTHWQVVDKETMRHANEEAIRLISAQNPKGADELRKSMQQTAFLITLSIPPAHPGQFAPNIVCTAEEVRSRGVRTAEAYLRHSAQEMQKANMPVSLTGEPRAGKIGNREFVAQAGQFVVPGTRVQQYYYTTMVGDHALSFVLSYTNSQEFGELLRALQSIHFN